MEQNGTTTSTYKKQTKKKRNNKPALLIILFFAIAVLIVAFFIVSQSVLKNNRTQLTQANNATSGTTTDAAKTLPEIYKGNALIGTWRYDEYNTYEFKTDGTGSLVADEIVYDYSFTIKEGSISIDFDKDIVKDCEYEYSISDGKLTLIGGEGTDGGTYILDKLNG